MLEDKLRTWTIVNYESVIGWVILTFPFEFKEKAQKWLDKSRTIHGQPIYPMGKVVETARAHIMVIESKIEMEQDGMKIKRKLIEQYKKELAQWKEKLLHGERLKLTQHSSNG